MEGWVLVHSADFQLHLYSHMEVGSSPATTPPILTVNFQHGSFTSTTEYSFLPQFRRILEDPSGWRLDVQRRLLLVLRGHPSLDVSFLVRVFCSYCDAALHHFSQLYGTRAISINALIIPSPTPIHLSLPGAPTAAELGDEIMVLWLEDVQGGGAGGGGEFSGTPASASAIREHVKVAIFGKAEEERVDADKTCSICLEDFERAQRLLVMPCQHRFHLRCLKQWLDRSHVCPLCRFPLPVEEIIN